MYSMTLSATISLTSFRAVPDLTFSEVAFLNTRRLKQDTVAQPVPEKKRRRKDKTAAADEEMSRFFTAKSTDQKEDAARRDQNSRRPSPTHCMTKGFEGTDRATTAPFSPPVELPELPFLGFGSSGINTLSPVKVTVSGDAPYGTITPRRPHSSTRSSIGSSSYYTWTTTPSSKAHRRCGTDGTSSKVCRDSPKTRKPLLSSVAHCQSRSKESVNDKALHFSEVDTEINHNSLESQALNLDNASPHKANRSEEGEAEKSFCSGQKPRSGAAIHLSSLAGGEPAHGEPAHGEPAHGEPAANAPDQSLRREADDQADNECQGATELEAKERTVNGFPLCFDEALERLLDACNFPSNQLKTSISTPRMSKYSDQVQYRDGLDNNSKSENVGKLGRILAPCSQSIDYCKEYSKRNCGLQSPSLTITNHTSYSTTSLLDNDNGNYSTTLARKDRGSKPPTEVPARSISTQETFSHGHGRRHPSDAWRGYRNIYQGQLLPDVDAGSNEYNISSGENSFDRRGGMWPTHQSGSAKDISEAFPAIDEESLSHNVQDHPNSYDDDTDYWEPTSDPLYNESQHYQAPDYGDGTSDLLETIPIPSFAATKRTKSPESSDSLDARITTSAMSTEHCGDDNTLNGHQQLDQAEPCDAHWAGFWRPNKLY